MSDDSESVMSAVDMLGTEVTFTYCGEEYTGIVTDLENLQGDGAQTYVYTVGLRLHPPFVGEANIYRLRPQDAWTVRSLHITRDVG